MITLITAATIDDAEEILALQKTAFKSEAERYGDFHIEPLTQTIEEMRADFAGYVFLKAMQEGRIIGSIKGRMIDGTSCWIGRLMVHPDLRYRGIGTQLLQEIESRFDTARRYELATGHKSLNNIRLYEKAGYRIFKREKINDGLEFVHMEKTRPAEG